MTAKELLDALTEFIELNTKDIILQVRKRRGSDGITSRSAEVHQMKLPTKDDETEKIPYILLQVLTGKDTTESAIDSSVCKVRIVIATYSEDASEGTMDVLNLINRIRINLLKQRQLDKRFDLKLPLEYIIYPDDTAPYYLGEMITEWSIPTIEREVDFNW